MALYYVIVFNRFFDGIDGKMLKQSLFMKKLTRNIMLVVIGIALMTILNTQNMMFGKLLTIDDNDLFNNFGIGLFSFSKNGLNPFLIPLFVKYIIKYNTTKLIAIIEYL